MSVRTTVKSIQDIMRQDAGVDGDAQRISQLCWMFFLKIIDDQDQELELTQDDYRSPIPEQLPVAHLGGGPGGHHRRGAARLHQRRAVPGAEGLAAYRQAGRPPPRRPRRVRGCLQLHEIRPADAAGRQQDQRGRFQQSRRAPALRRHLRADSSTTCNRPAMPASITRRAPSPPSWSIASIRTPAKSCSIPPAARAAFSPAPSTTCGSTTSRRPKTSARRCRAACARSRRSSCRTCSASPTCCCTASRTRASCATTTRWPGR